MAPALRLLPFLALSLMAAVLGCTDLPPADSRPAIHKSAAFIEAEDAYLHGRVEESERAFGALVGNGTAEGRWAAYYRGRCRLALGRTAEAAADFARALSGPRRAGPESAKGGEEPLASYAASAAGDAARALGDNEAALALFSAADPRFERADALLYKQGLCLDALGRREEARARFDEMLRRFPASDLAGAARARQEQASASDEETAGGWEGKHWAQLGIFSSRERADSVASQAKAALPALAKDIQVVAVGADRGREFHVRIGPYDKPEPAQGAKEKAKAKGMDAMVKGGK
jgi:tetratricopeptide (TPR) repeat protein